MDKVMEPKQFIQIATSYIERGLSVIPVGVDKKPLVDWKQYQSRRATSKEVEQWAKQFKNPNIAIVTGKISGIVVVDVEAGGKTDDYNPTVIARSGGGGWHFYYKHPGYELKNSARKLRELTDIRGDGGYVVAPPSLHKSGNHYEWSASPDMSGFTDVPDWVLQSLTPAKVERHEENDWEKLLTQDNHEGTRNDMAAKVAGYLLSTVNQPYWDSTGWASFTAWNLTHNKSPLPDRELRQVWDSIKSRAGVEMGLPKSSLATNDEIMPDVRPMRYSELAKLDIPAPTWIVDKLIPAGSITIISAAPAQYKTWLTFDIAIQVAFGKPLFSQFETKQKNVLIVDEESGLGLVRERLQKLGIADDAPIFITSYDNFKIDETNANSLIAYCNTNAVGLVVFDSLTRIHNGDENLAKDMSVVMGDLKRLAQKGIAVLLIHHNRKPVFGKPGGANEMRGSGDILAACDVQISLQRKTGSNVIKVTQNKNRNAAELAPFELEVNIDENKFWFDYIGSKANPKSQREQVEERIIELLTPDKRLYQGEIKKAVKDIVSTNVAADVLAVMVSQQKLSTTKGSEKNKSYYQLPVKQTNE